ncbi:alpha/beta hydrolase fold domain-containing protein [Nocardiopsis lambiniae]|uniref:Alpha/beta hydrolase fold domain-containing protein n=1 Tax=Nocardiopsis lambiniae TaxID=3075539 RepID=A0ABU2MD77_9ACTN|nr:alpha/beta hydrolase fold domain-containing protein [Nocardiopsis sp. DSM 44743]MDT0330221.1 alpha/beta hydrolase fold domain-containing protein [Nocardiopsis sp. DSM 44743]
MSTPPPPPFDPELAASLALLGDQIPPSITPDLIGPMRAARADQAVEGDFTHEGHYTEHALTVKGHDGADVPLILWRPTWTDAPTGLLYWIHGGGMIVGTHRGSEIPELLAMAHSLGLAVASIGYRLAPEHPHPTPVEDCYSGLVHLTDPTAHPALDAARVIVGGASAGGGLAAATALLARDRGGPRLSAQLLVYPMLDDRNDTVSAHQMAGLGVWDRTSNDTGWSALLGEARGGPDVSPYAAPARATDLSNLPPAFLDVGSTETFRDEIVDYATRLWQAGGIAELHVWPGAFHGFDNFAPHAALSREAAAARLSWLHRTLGA